MAMARIRIISLITAIAVIFITFPVSGADSGQTPVVEKSVTITTVLNDGTVITYEEETDEASLETLAKRGFNQDPITKNAPKKMSNFMMGAELSTGLDLSGSDLSTFNLDFLIGYRHKAIQLLGVQFGAHKALGDRDCFLPICLVFRSSFSAKPKPVFFHLSAGYSFNTVSSSKMFGDVTATIGCGVNLVQRSKFQSVIIVAFGFRHFNERHQDLISIDKSNCGFAQISFGISI